MKGWKKRNSGDPPTPVAPPQQQLPSSAESDGRGEDECAHLVDRTPTTYHESDEHLLNQRKNFMRRAADGAAGDDEEGEEDEDMEYGTEKGDDEEYLNSLQGEEDGDAGAGDGEGEEEEDEEKGEPERPTLAEGFFEIESVRRKRVRKGQVQYLIKWRGWPETENTWEPVENLMSVYDVIDAFEESLRSGKRKRKRKHGSSTQSQIRKKQHLCSPSSTDVKVRVSAEPLSFSSHDDIGVTHAATGGQINESGVMNGNLVSPRIEAREEELNDLDTKLKGARATDNDEENHLGKFAVHSQEAAQVSGQVAVENGSANSDYTETFQSGRCTGARRRKSGSVKRFKQETTTTTTTSCKSDDPDNNVAFSSVGSGLGGNQVPPQNSDFVGGNDLGYKNKTDSPNDFCNITEIIRPLSYSSSMTNNMQDITVTFMAKRSDGKEVTVDNKFLKSNHPLLLINFYEQNLVYTPI